MWNNYAEAGVTKLLLSEALDTPAKRERLHEAVPGAAIVVRQQAPGPGSYVRDGQAACLWRGQMKVHVAPGLAKKPNDLAATTGHAI